VFLLALSFLWTTLFAGGPALSEEDYARLEELENQIVDMHLQIEQVKRRSGNEASPEEGSVAYRNAIEERDALRAKLESNVQRPSSTATVLRYGGLGLIVVGLIAYWIKKPA